MYIQASPIGYHCITTFLQLSIHVVICILQHFLLRIGNGSVTVVTVISIAIIGFVV